MDNIKLNSKDLILIELLDKNSRLSLKEASLKLHISK